MSRSAQLAHGDPRRRVTAVPASAHAGGFGIPELGARRTGMGAEIERPDDATRRSIHNPAGLVLSHGLKIYVGGGVAFLSTSFSLAPWTDSNQYLGVQPNADGYYSAVTPTRSLGVIPFVAVTDEVIPDKLYMGLAFYVGNGTGAQFHHTAVTRYDLIDGYIVSPQTSLAAAYRVTPTINFGATVGVMNIRVHGERDVYPILEGANVGVLVGTSPDLKLDGSAWAPTWSLGFYGEPTSRITWGLSLVGRVNATEAGPVTVTEGSDSPTPGAVLTGTQQTQTLLPWTFLGGVNVDVTPHVEVGADLRYWLYRQYKQESTQIEGIFLVRLLITTKDYSDSQQVSGGVRIHDLDAAPKLELMAGMHYDHSPAPSDTLTLDQPSFSHIGVHSGARYSWGRYRGTLTYVHYWYLVPTVTADSITDPPLNFKGSGQNNIVSASIEVSL